MRYPHSPFSVDEGRLTTQLGSLPHNYEDGAVAEASSYDEAILQAVGYATRDEIDIPCIPELVRLRKDERMERYLDNPGRLVSIEAFKEAVNQQERQYVKVQVLGPVSAVMMPNYRKYDKDEILQRAAEHLAAQIDGIEAPNVIICLDEPSFGQAVWSDNFEEDYETLRLYFEGLTTKRNYWWMGHYCGDCDWDIILKSMVLDGFHFNASLTRETVINPKTSEPKPRYLCLRNVYVTLKSLTPEQRQKKFIVVGLGDEPDNEILERLFGWFYDLETNRDLEVGDELGRSVITEFREEDGTFYAVSDDGRRITEVGRRNFIFSHYGIAPECGLGNIGICQEEAMRKAEHKAIQLARLKPQIIEMVESERKEYSEIF